MTLKDKMNRVLDILEKFEIIAPVSKEQQQKNNKFMNRVFTLLKKQNLRKRYSTHDT